MSDSSCSMFGEEEDSHLLGKDFENAEVDFVKCKLQRCRMRSELLDEQHSAWCLCFCGYSGACGPARASALKPELSF